MNHAVGIVFGGGGGKGAYQIGVWKALHELGVCDVIKGVSGTSVGALNGAMFCAGGLDIAVKAWRSVSEDKILTRNDADYNGWFSNDGLKEMIHKYVDMHAIKNSELTFYAAATRIRIFSTSARYFKVKDFDVSTIKDILQVSSAIPFVFPDVMIEKDFYVDGGIKDSVPIKPLYNDGLRKFLVVALNTEYKITKRRFPDAKFLELPLDEGVEPLSLVDTLDFTRLGAEARLNLGYEYCMSMAGKITRFIHRG